MNHPERPRPSRTGFTLIELLVVISIVALLIGILLPVLGNARRKGKQMSCGSSLRGIVQGLEVFTVDTNGAYPIAGSLIAWDRVDTMTSLPSWMQQVHAYLDTDKTYQCPTFPGEDDMYHYFLGTRAAWIRNGVFSPVEQKYLRTPSAYVISGDTNYNFGFDPTFGPDADKDDYTQAGVEWDWQTTGTHWQPHHEGGLWVAFADGHADVFREFDPAKMTFRYDTMSAW